MPHWETAPSRGAGTPAVDVNPESHWPLWEVTALSFAYLPRELVGLSNFQGGPFQPKCSGVLGPSNLIY